MRTTWYGRIVDVELVRTFRNGDKLGIGYDRKAWYVWTRPAEANAWEKHCGPYGDADQAREWIRDIREAA